MASIKYSRVLKDDEFKKELEKLNNMEAEKTSIKLSSKQTTSDEVLIMLKDYDVVEITLNDNQVLRVSSNNRWQIGDRYFGFNASDTEKGFTYREKRKEETTEDYLKSRYPISVNYTGHDKMKRVLDFFLNDIY